MTIQEITNIIYKIIYDKTDITPLSLNQPLWNDAEMDSLDYIEIIILCENRFHIHTTDEEMENLKMKTIGDFINYIYQKTQTLESKLIENKLIKIGNTINQINADTIRRTQILNQKIKGK